MHYELPHVEGHGPSLCMYYFQSSL
eukprot:SAG31_NODE_31671_length_365_cov_1.150376_1_plen_24_part_01